MLWILLARIVHLERMRGRRRGAVSCVNTLRLCALVSLLKVYRTAALYSRAEVVSTLPSWAEIS